MEPMIKGRQQDLFKAEEPPLSLPTERRAKVLQLLQALLVETLASTPGAEDGDDQDHL